MDLSKKTLLLSVLLSSNSPARGWEKWLQWRLQWPHPVGSFFPGPSKASQFNTVSATPRGNTADRPGISSRRTFLSLQWFKVWPQGSIGVGPVYSTTDDLTPPVITEEQFNRRTILGNNRLTQKSVLTQKVLSKSVCVCTCLWAREKARERGRERNEAGECSHHDSSLCLANFKIRWL